MQHWKSFLLTGILVVVALVGVTACTPEQLKAFQGTVKNVDTVSGNITVTLKDGSTQSFSFTDVKADTIKQAIGDLNLEPGDDVTIEKNEKGEVEHIKSPNAEVSGIIKSLGNNTITITTQKKGDIQLNVTANTTITIEDHGKAPLSALRAGLKAEAKYNVETKNALRINVNNENNGNDEHDGDVEGKISAIDTNNKTITLDTRKGPLTLQITADTSIRIEDKGTAAFSDLKTGQKVEVKYDVSSLKALKIVVGENQQNNREQNNKPQIKTTTNTNNKNQSEHENQNKNQPNRESENEKD